ncbi:MAG: 3,4-dihydroxy-2-butanone-4-phosphate synthase [Alphaproteobacteria bacterium]|nr:3,4-dihydroxy-2-butanone-4-phosphate synthase [Alphaproteobacteria bacterium]
MVYTKELATIEQIVEDAKQGKMFILVDDEGRENEGDLIIPAQKADASAINFMAKYGRGLICLSMDSKRIRELKLPLMSQSNGTRHQTAFTISIEAKEGVTTGISAADRARTIAVAIDPAYSYEDIVTPGHIFPLEAKDGGVLVRAGHTEAAVDIARMAGFLPAGVICEIMNDDGTMARLPDLLVFAKQHDLHVASIADLIAYRLRRDHLIERVTETLMDSCYGGQFKLIVYRNTVHYAEHIALVKGEISNHEPTLVRMHTVDLTADMLGDTFAGANTRLQQSMEQIAQKGAGVIVVLREPNKASLSETILERLGKRTEPYGNLREYGIGAQILRDLGVHEMILLTNSKRAVVGIEGYGLKIVGYKGF